MDKLSEGLPIIIQKSVPYSCFAGIVKGTVEATVYDQGTDEFPAKVEVKGKGGTELTLKGNEKREKKVNDITIEVTISQWKCTKAELSFHVKAEGKKSIFKCTVIDETLSGKRKVEV